MRYALVVMMLCVAVFFVWCPVPCRVCVWHKLAYPESIINVSINFVFFARERVLIVWSCPRRGCTLCGGYLRIGYTKSDRDEMRSRGCFADDDEHKRESEAVRANMNLKYTIYIYQMRVFYGWVFAGWMTHERTERRQCACAEMMNKPISCEQSTMCIITFSCFLLAQAPVKVEWGGGGYRKLN